MLVSQLTSNSICVEKVNIFIAIYLQEKTMEMGIENKSIPEEVSIPIPYGHISGELWNGLGGEIPILAAHGWLDNAGTWDTLLPLINQNFPILAIDLPGYGLSSPRPAGTGGSVFESVIILDRIINYFNWDKVILMGHSMGAEISSLYAGTFPKKVVKLILIDLSYPPSIKAKKFPEKTARYLRSLPPAESKLTTNPPQYSYNAIVDKMVSSYAGISVESAKCLLRRGATRHRDNLYSFNFSPLEKIGDPIGNTFETVKAYVSQITCDVLIIKAKSGRDERRSEFSEVMNIYRNNCKSFYLVGLEGTHHIHLNDPVHVADSINRFLVGLPQNKAYLMRPSDIITSKM